MTTEKVLDDYVNRRTLAEMLGCSPRTIPRYENEPNGLPSLEVAGRKLYRIESVKKWLEGREKRPNPRRVA